MKKKNIELYKIAVEGYQKHWEHYNHWMNMNAIFNGALFVGYYSVSDNACNNRTDSLLVFFILVLGVISGWCWHFSVCGFYRWIISWINVVKMHEKNALENKHIYRAFINPDSKKGKIYKKFFLTHPFSTQKLMKCFTMSVAIVWTLLLLNNTFPSLENLIKELRFKHIDLKIISVLILFVILIMFIIWLGRETDLKKTHYLYEIIGKDGFKDMWDYDEATLSRLIKKTDVFFNNLYFQVRTRGKGEIQSNNGFIINRECRYAGHFYEKERISIFVGFCDEYGYCISLYGDKEEEVEEVIYNVVKNYVVDYNSFDNHNWYTIVLKGEELNEKSTNNCLESILDEISKIVSLIES